MIRRRGKQAIGETREKEREEGLERMNEEIKRGKERRGKGGQKGIRRVIL